MKRPFHSLEKLAPGRILVHHDTDAAKEEALKRRRMRKIEGHIFVLETASVEAAAQAAVAATEFKHDITGIYNHQI